MAEFCIRCGSPLHEGAIFCSSCGARVAMDINPPGVDYGLPIGMTQSPDGTIWWHYADKKVSYLYGLDDDTILSLLEKKKKSFARELFEDVVNLYTSSSDPLCFMSDPFPDNEDAPTVTMNGREYFRRELRLSEATALKEDRKHNLIQLKCSSYWWDFYCTDAQYDFLKHYVLTHRPDIEQK